MPIIIQKRISQILFLFLFTYSILYFSYKYYIPIFGASDSFAYYEMYQKPLDFSATTAPFVYRQFHAVIVYIIYKVQIFYEVENAFLNNTLSQSYDIRIFFAAILSNYIGLLLAGFVSIITLECKVKKVSFLLTIFTGLLCFTSFFTQQSILTGLSEGWSWFFVALCYFFYVKKHLILFTLTLIISIFQRELIPIIFGTIAFMDFIFSDKDKRAYFIKLCLISILVFVTHIILRKYIIPVSGYESQLSIQSIIHLLGSFSISKELIFQGIISQNIFGAFLLITSIVVFKEKEPVSSTYIFHLLSALFVLYLMGIMVGINNNIGRIGALITPIVIIHIIENGLKLKEFEL